MNINNKIQYFNDYWRDLTHDDNSIEEELVHSILYNPKELIKEFIEEIERKNLSNKDNKIFFIDKINEFSKLELECLSFIKPTLKLVQGQFYKKNDYDYLLHILKILVVKLQDFTLANEAINELSKILTNSSKINKIKIKHLTNLIIFELMNKKYSRETISIMINDILEANNLTQEKKILSLKNYFIKKSERLRFIFQIRGLRGDHINITIGDVQIYNPKTIQLFKNPRFKNITEYFDESFTDYTQNTTYYCNGAVTIEIIDEEYAKEEALQKLEMAIDIISTRYENYTIPITINKSQYIIIDKGGKLRGHSISFNGEYQDYLELDNITFNSEIYKKQIEKNTILKIDKQILDSIHWKRKAIESNANNEKILWHWIALENIYKKKNQSTPKIIFEVISKLLAKKNIFDFAWKYYYKLSNVTTQEAKDGHYKLKIDLPQELKNKIGLNAKYGEKIHLNNLIDNIDVIKYYIEEDSFLYEEFEFLQDIFSDKKKCLNLIEKFQKIFFEKLVYLYRIRNKIVHNADNEEAPILRYYVDFITSVSSLSINTFIDKRATLSLKTTDDIVNNILYDYDEFKLKLDEQGTKILLRQDENN